MGSPGRVPTVSARLALPLLTEWKRRGGDPSALLERLGLEEAQLRALRGRLALDAWSDLHAACSEESGDAAFAVRAVERLERSAFPLELHLVGSQATVREGLDLVRPYASAVIDGLDIAFAHGPGGSHARFRLGGEPLGPPKFAEYLLAMLWAFVRAVAPSSPPPTAVQFTHRWPRHGEATRTTFAAPVSFGCRDVGFAFRVDDLEAPIPLADPELGAMLAAKATEWLASAPTELRLRDRARHWLGANLAGDAALASRLAEAMHLSERSLRRKLREEGTSLRGLVEDVRRDRAIALLEAGELGLDAIAVELGFSSANAFGRAFRAWTGVPPSEFARGRRAES